MPHGGKTAPALSWRAFFVFALLSMGGFPTAATGAAPPVKPPELAQSGKPDPAEAARILEQFRHSGIPGDYFLGFELRALPRRGEEKVFQGQLWGSRNEQGAVTRIELTDGSGKEHRLIVQNGERAGVWRLVDGKPVRLGVAELFEPLIPGVEITAFDVQMPFLYWPDATLEKISRVRGRPTHAFLFRAPESFTAKHARIAAARAYLDTQYNALLKTELIGDSGRVVKSFSLLSLKTVDKQPLPKSIDYRNEITRDKTRFLVTEAALNLRLDPAVFAPATLARDVPPPAPAHIVRLD